MPTSGAQDQQKKISTILPKVNNTKKKKHVKTRKIFLPPILTQTQRPKSRMQFDQSGLEATQLRELLQPLKFLSAHFRAICQAGPQIKKVT